MDPMAMMTAKSEMKFLQEAGKKGVVFAFFNWKDTSTYMQNIFLITLDIDFFEILDTFLEIFEIAPC